MKRKKLIFLFIPLIMLVLALFIVFRGDKKEETVIQEREITESPNKKTEESVSVSADAKSENETIVDFEETNSNTESEVQSGTVSESQTEASKDKSSDSKEEKKDSKYKESEKDSDSEEDNPEEKESDDISSWSPAI